LDHVGLVLDLTNACAGPLFVAAAKVAAETQRNALQRAIPKSSFGDNESQTAQKSVMRPSGLDHEKNPICVPRKLGPDGWMMNKPENYNGMMSGYHPPKDVQNSQGFCSVPEQIAAGHSNFWHTVNAHYQDQQGNHNMFPGSWSMLAPSSGFGLNKQNYPLMQEVGGFPQRSANPKFGNGAFTAVPGRGTDQHSAGWVGNMMSGAHVEDSQSRLIKPQPLIVAHGDEQKSKGNSCKLFGIHLDSPAKCEALKSPSSVGYDGMPQTPVAAEWRRSDPVEIEKCSDPPNAPKQLDSPKEDSVPEKHLVCTQASISTQCKPHGGATRSCKKVCFSCHY
jgi:hypothetical protein